MALASNYVVTQCVEVYAGDCNRFLFQFPTPNNAIFQLAKRNPNDTYTIVVPFLNFQYGTRFDFGSYPTHPNYAGFEIDWTLVLNAFGSGQYVFRAQYTNPNGLVTSLASFPFLLQVGAKKGVFIEVRQTGLHKNFLEEPQTNIPCEFDLTCMDWEDCCRYQANFYEIVPEVSQTFIEYDNCKRTQGYTEHFQQYRLSINPIVEELFNRLYLYGGNSETIVITTDNEDEEFKFEKWDIVRTTVNKFEKDYQYVPLLGAEIEFKRRYDKGFKR